MMRKNAWAPLIVAALLLFGGCSRAEPLPTAVPTPTPVPLEERVQGEGVCPDVDRTEALFAAVAGELFPAEGAWESLAPFCEMPILKMDRELALGADGTFVLAFDEADCRAAERVLRETLKAALRDYLLDAVREAGGAEDAEIDAAFVEEAMGMTLEELYETIGLEQAFSALENAELSGVWKAEGEALTLTADGEGVTASYDTSADVLTVMEDGGALTFGRK